MLAIPRGSPSNVDPARQAALGACQGSAFPAKLRIQALHIAKHGQTDAGHGDDMSLPAAKQASAPHGFQVPAPAEHYLVEYRFVGRPGQASDWRFQSHHT
jgi:hypothetical protein